MILQIDCPHCHREITVPADVQTICPQCRGRVIGDSSVVRATPRQAAAAAPPWQGGALLYTVLLLLGIPLILWGAWVFDLGRFLPEAGSLLFMLGLGVYFLPTLIAAHRRSVNANLILLLNLFAGITVIGWVAAFIWSALDKRAVD